MRGLTPQSFCDNVHCVTKTQSRVRAWLVALRDERGMTQRGQAAALGISELKLGRVNRGTQAPDLALAELISQQFSVPLATVLLKDPPARYFRWSSPPKVRAAQEMATNTASKAG